MARLTALYADDEALAIRASGDSPLLRPRDQKVAEGLDGAFAAGVRWTLTSATEGLTVAGESAGSVTLKRKGQDAGVGQPPGPIAGAAGVRFQVATLGPQIEPASHDLNRRYGIDDLVAGRRTAELYDARDVTDARVLTVLRTQYLAMARNSGEVGGDFAREARHSRRSSTSCSAASWSAGPPRPARGGRRAPSPPGFPG